MEMTITTMRSVAAVSVGSNVGMDGRCEANTVDANADVDISVLRRLH
jgi:hypothetical protein